MWYALSFQSEDSVRLAAGIRPVFGEVDTCAGEFKAKTPYYYSYYKYEDSKPGRASQSPVDFPLSDSPKRIMVLGGTGVRTLQEYHFSSATRS